MATPFIRECLLRYSGERVGRVRGRPVSGGPFTLLSRRTWIDEVERLRKELDELLDRLLERIRQCYPEAKLSKSTFLAMLAETRCPGCLLKKVVQKHKGSRDGVDPWHREKHNMAVDIGSEALYEYLENMGYDTKIATEAEGTHGRVDILIRITRYGMNVIDGGRTVIVEVKTGSSISFYQLLRYLLDHPDAILVIWRPLHEHIDSYKPEEIGPMLIEFLKMCIRRARRFLKSRMECNHKLPAKKFSKGVPKKDLKAFSEALSRTLPEFVNEVARVLDLNGKSQINVSDREVSCWPCVADKDFEAISQEVSVKCKNHDRR